MADDTMQGESRVEPGTMQKDAQDAVRTWTATSGNVRQFHEVAQRLNADYKLEGRREWLGRRDAALLFNGVQLTEWNQMVRQWRRWLLVFSLYGSLATAQPGRGELLYSTYCNACHTEQVHWRDRRLVTDWSSLVAEVRRWQKNANLEWSEDDVKAVAHYLNHLYYHYQ